ncbi:MAG TPA: protein kinase [Myxococcales bacterium]|jgi:serine/threonine-protein kinase
MAAVANNSDLQLGKYRLLERIGRGGMAEVFLAEVLGPGGFQKTVALKRIHPHLAEDPEFVGMFLDEARLAARLDHPNIVQIFDLGEADGSYYIAMEYVDGPCLRTLCQRSTETRSPLPPGIAARIVADACEGLAFAHEAREDGRLLQLVHRDISPDNVLLRKSGAVKVADFGIAKAMAKQRRTQVGVIRGKVWYMPPEQLLDDPLDRRVDVFALGVVLYELLSGLSPFEASNETRAIKAILDDPPVPLLERRPDCPPELWEIIATALEKDREARFSDCRGLKRALERFLMSRQEIVGAHEVSQRLSQLFPELYGEVTAPLPARAATVRSTLPQRRASSVACPGCGSAMSLGHSGGVVVDGCSTCGGIWLDEGEMQQLANRPAGLVAMARLYKPTGEWDLAERERGCPRCRTGLEPYEFNSLRGIWLDRCATCRGLFLDHGEAEAIEARLRQAGDE